MTRLKICQVSAEVTPLAKTGGLGDVVAALSRTLARAGHDVRVVMPCYPSAREAAGEAARVPGLERMSLTLGGRGLDYAVRAAALPGSDLPLYLLDCPELYDRAWLYTEDADEHQRFAFLARAAIEVCQHLAWGPDVVHCHDWHAGLLPLYLSTRYAWDKLFEETRTVLTVHNVGYQGVFGADVLASLDLEHERHLLPSEDLAVGCVNYLRTGLVHADRITTVSETYAREIQTDEYGMGMQGVLRHRARDVIGIVNGVDYGEWDPEHDPLIPHRYAAHDLGGKALDKKVLVQEAELSFDRRVPVIGMVTRLTSQKGVELLPEVLPALLQHSDLRLVVLGSGEEEYERCIEGLRAAFPAQVAFRRGYDNAFAHLVEAGSDLFLMPSRYEPCGLSQLYSLRYGTIPVVRRTGGLADTVEPFDPRTGEGTGFLFDAFSSEALLRALTEAVDVWRDPATWLKLVRNAMLRDFSWEHQAPRYVEMYRELVGASER